MRSFGLPIAALGALVGVMLAEGAWAQGTPSWQNPPPSAQPPPRPPQQQQAPTKQGQPPAKRPAETGGAASSTEAGLRQRVEQLEEQLVDLQVVVGTVESLARTGGPSTASTAFRAGQPVGGGGTGADAGRIAALETQVQALTSQLEQMAEQLRQLQSGAPRGPSGPAPRAGGPATPGGFGTTTVTPGSDPIASIINQDRGPAPQRAAAAQTMDASPAGRQQYEQAYSLLLQQNYPAAETGFSEFLQRFPQDEMAPNAQFWLGETFFVRSQWDAAAAAFLKVAQAHPKSDKAPDSLAKFAMSMERKGNRPAACRALQELKVRYPNPPAHVRTWEAAERKRAGCS